MSGHGRKDHLVMNTFGTSLDEQHLATGISMLDCLLQGSANFFCKKPHTLDFANYVVSVATTNLCYCGVKAVNEWVWLCSNELYLQNRQQPRFGPKTNLPTTIPMVHSR